MTMAQPSEHVVKPDLSDEEPDLSPSNDDFPLKKKLSANAKFMLTELEARGVEGIAYLDTWHVRFMGKNREDWIDHLTHFDTHLIGMAYFLFYRENIRDAHRLLKKMDELCDDFGKYVDMTIMYAECEIVMGDNSTDTSTRVLDSLISSITKYEIQLSQEFVEEYDEALAQNGRHIARIFLRYMAYISIDLEITDDDILMSHMVEGMKKIAHRFLKLERSRVKYLMSNTMKRMFQYWYNRVGELDRGDTKNIAYVRALCCNYKAWICIKVGLDKDAVKYVCDGVEILQQEYPDMSYRSFVLFGDLKANMAAAAVHLNRSGLAVRAYREAQDAYDRADVTEFVAKDKLKRRLQETGVRTMRV